VAAECAGAEQLLREAGAAGVLSSTLQAPGLARLARRHCRQTASTSADFDESLAERMPWPAHAAARD
jgi:hypothetical protein